MDALLTRIFECEARRDLFNLDVDGIHPWPLVRGFLPGWARLLNGHGAQHRGRGPRAIREYWRTAMAMSTAVMQWPALREASPQIVLLQLASRRFKPIVGTDRDPFMWPLVEKLSPRPFFAMTPSEQYPAAISALARTVTRILARSPSHGRALEAFGTDLAPVLQVPTAALRRLITRNVTQVAIERRVYRALLRRLAPPWVGLVSSGPHRALKVAAQDLQIPVVELQHGIVTPAHLGYHFPGGPVVPYAPRLFLTWGPAWTQAVTMPANCRPMVVGAAYLAHVAEQARTGGRDSSMGVISLQGIESLAVLSRARDLAILTPHRRWICCPHPNEDRTVLEKWCEEHGPTNLEMARPGACTLSLIARADVHIGVASTVVLEGLALGARTIVWSDMPFAESYVRPILTGHRVAFTTNVPDTVSALATLTQPDRPDGLFAALEADIPRRIEQALSASLTSSQVTLGVRPDEP